MTIEISKFKLQDGGSIRLYMSNEVMSLEVEQDPHYVDAVDVDLTEDEVFRLIEGLTEMVELTHGMNLHLHQCNVFDKHAFHTWRPLHDVSGISIVTCPGVDND